MGLFGRPTSHHRDVDAERIGRTFERKFGIAFRDPFTLKTALTHRSKLEPEGTGVSNERLEFLGDSVLGLIASDYLFRSMDEANEGELTKARSRLVSKNVLGRIGIRLGILDLLIYAREELRDDERALTTLSADALEALIGAIYIDRGMAYAARFVIDRIVDPMGDISADKSAKPDSKCSPTIGL